MREFLFACWLGLLSRLPVDVGFPLALAALLLPCVDAAGAINVCRRWRLSNKETELAGWLVQYHAALDDATTMRWSKLQPLLLAEGADDLLTLVEAASPQGAEAAAHCRRLLAQPREALDPPPLLTGNDLLAGLGVASDEAGGRVGSGNEPAFQAPTQAEMRTAATLARSAQEAGDVTSRMPETAPSSPRVASATSPGVLDSTVLTSARLVLNAASRSLLDDRAETSNCRLRTSE